jgi:hypothetical protein
MTVEINSSNTVAVDREYYWQPMDTCPRGVKVQLLGAGGVAVYGQYHGKDPWWTHWAPLPVKPKNEPVKVRESRESHGHLWIDALYKPQEEK